jgi:23S rRNA pseudouridine1911/1915/1917 synthase
LCCSKTQGRAGGESSLEDAVRAYLGGSARAEVYVGTVHRLDRVASGVVLWAKTPKAARRLAGQFAARQARKEYWAIVAGTPPNERGLWDDWLCVDDTLGRGVVQVCRRQAPRARQAITRIECARAVALPEGCSWLRLWPETGRTHQLRVQAAARGWPILGDAAYGSTRPFPCGIALHGRSLTVQHPAQLEPITFRAPPPEAWASAGIVLAEAHAD